MPTAYTSQIAEGISPRQFILNCARAMGAYLHQRDESMSVPSRKREVSDYYPTAITSAQERLAALEALSPEETAVRCAEYNARRVKEVITDDVKDTKREEQYHAMLAAVRQWVPPTLDHYGLKEFMEQQIMGDMDFDRRTRVKTEAPPQLTPAEWLANQLADARWDLEYTQKNYAEEVKRVADANAWIDALHASLPTE